MRCIFLLIALIVPLPALALSCMAPSVERSFARFAEAEETYVIVHGRLTLDVKALPKGMSADRDPPKMTRIPAKLVGRSMGRNGFDLPFDQAVTLEVSCLGPWCGSARNGEDVLAFVRKSDNGYALAITPCGGSVFGAPKPSQLRLVKQCFRKARCPSP